MALVILSTKELNELRNLLGGFDSALIIVEREAMEEAGITEAQASDAADYYDFGGEPDVMLDVVDMPDHMFLRDIVDAQADK